MDPSARPHRKDGSIGQTGVYGGSRSVGSAVWDSLYAPVQSLLGERVGTSTGSTAVTTGDGLGVLSGSSVV